MNRRLNIIVCLALAALTFAAFYRILGNEFINYDDDVFVTTNPVVQAGLTAQSVSWAFKSTLWAQWQPLVWLSYMLDYEVWKLNPLGFHLTNLLLHIAGVVLLYLVLVRLTRSTGRSALVAGLFAVHPLHVESVAWVAERKDVLSTLFWMLTMWAYVRYAEFKVQSSRFKVAAYLSVIVLFALGLMSKPMLVTLPFVLLLLDYWPLGRFRVGAKHVGAKHLQGDHPNAKTSPANALSLLEKIPLFVLAAASSILTYLIQQKGGAVSGLWELPLGIRLANSLAAYTGYIVKMVWPTKLAFLYPHPEGSLPVWQVIGSGIALVALTALALWAARRRPYIGVGWLWYVGTLVPVIGVVQVGGQAMADRYTYVPLVGLFIALAWGLPGVVAAARPTSPTCPTSPTSPGMALVAGVAVIALAACAWAQTGYWKDNRAVFSRALECTSRNYLAHNNMGLVLAHEAKPAAAIRHYEKALEIAPRFPLAHNNLGLALESLGRLDQAIKHYQEAVRLNPGYAEAHNNLGNALAILGRLDEAAEHYSEVVRIQPADFMAHYRLANVLFEQKRWDEAVSEYREAIRLRPDMVEARNNLAVALYLSGRYAEAWDEVHALEQYGSRPHEQFLRALASKMPEPK